MNFVPTATSLFMKLSIVAQVAGNDGTKSIHHSDSRLVWIHDCTPPTRSSVQSRLCTEAGPKNPAAISSVSHMARALTRTLRHIHHVCYFLPCWYLIDSQALSWQSNLSVSFSPSFRHHCPIPFDFHAVIRYRLSISNSNEERSQMHNR